MYSGDGILKTSTANALTGREHRLQIVNQDGDSIGLLSGDSREQLRLCGDLHCDRVDHDLGSPTPTGNVHFYWQVGAGGRTEFDVPLRIPRSPRTGVAGQAKATGSISTLLGNATAYTITAEYGGDVNHTVSTPMTASSSLTVSPQATTTALVTTRPLPSGSTYGENVTFTATVSHATPAPLDPAGSIAFFDGATLYLGPRRT